MQASGGAAAILAARSWPSRIAYGNWHYRTQSATLPNVDLMSGFPPGEGATRPCDECGELTLRLDLVPRRDGPEPWLPTQWICPDCDDDAALAATAEEAPQDDDESLDTAADEEG
jgi:hypothetical protein